MNDTLVLNFQQGSFTATFPTNGQYIAVQNTKQRLATHYSELAFGGAESQYAESLIDAIAHFSVLCPDFIKALQKPLLDLSLKEGREIVKVYSDQFRPWYNDLLNTIFEVNKPKDEQPTNTTNPTTESES